MSHKDDIMSIAVHPNGKIVATGEIGPKPLISVWNIQSQTESLVTFNSPLTKGIAHLAFSSSGKFLAASAMDDGHCVAIYEWQRKEDVKKKISPLYTTAKGTPSPIMAILFDPTEQMLIACAVKEVVFLNFQTGVIQPKKGTNWMKYGGQQTVLCGIYMGSTLITGVFNGSLLEWKGNSISQA